MAKRTVELPTDATEVAKAKYNLGMRSTVVGTGGGQEVYYKSGPAGTDYAGKPELVIRKMRNPVLPDYKQSGRRKALHACKGKRGCEFVECARTALGHVSTNMTKACGGIGRGPPRPTAAQIAGAREALMGLV